MSQEPLTDPESSLSARKQLTIEEKLRLIDELQGITKGYPSGTEMLLEDRRLERERELAKDGW
ncbi:MAG: hypothetical protein ABSG96_11845 [Terracidiphilus sp.]|jgi:hypothetical protein